MASLFGTGIPLSGSGQTDPATSLLLRQGFNQTPPRTILEGLGRVASGFAGINRQRTQQEELATALQGIGKDGDTSAVAQRLLQSSSPQAQRIGAQLLIQGRAAGAKTAATIAAEKRGIANKVETAKLLQPLKLERARAGRATTNINLPSSPRPQTVFEKELDKAQAKAFSTTNQQAVSARKANSALRAFKSATRNLPTGATLPAQLTIGRYAQALGINPAIAGLNPDQIASAETARTLSNQLVLEKSGQMKGQLSNRDVVFLEQSVPSIANTPEGNRRMVDIAIKLNNRLIKKAQMQAAFIRKHGRLNPQKAKSFDEEFKEFNERNPLFPQASQPGTAAPQRRHFNPQTGKIE